MAYTMEVNTDGGFLDVRHFGTTDADESIETGQAALQLAMDRKLLKVCVDVTGIAGRTSMIDLYKSTKFHAENARIRPKAAIYGRPDQLPELNFIETVGQNRGMHIKVFTDRAAALSWLLEL
jgi:hypothetical protein